MSVNAQSHLIKQLQREGMTALCVHVIDAPASRLLLESLRQKGVVVVTMVREVESDRPFDHAGWGDQDMGIRLSQALVNRAGGEALIVLLDPLADRAAGEVTDRSMWRRFEFLKRELHAYPSFEVLAEYDATTPEEASNAIARSLQEYPALDAWVSVNNWPLTTGDAASWAKTVTATGEGRRFLVFTEPTPPTWDVLTQGLAFTAIAPDYGAIAPRALDIAVTVLKGAGQHRGGGRIDLDVVDEAGLSGLRRRWEAWAQDSEG